MFSKFDHFMTVLLIFSMWIKTQKNGKIFLEMAFYVMSKLISFQKYQELWASPCFKKEATWLKQMTGLFEKLIKTKDEALQISLFFPSNYQIDQIAYLAWPFQPYFLNAKNMYYFLFRQIRDVKINKYMPYLLSSEMQQCLQIF